MATFLTPAQDAELLSLEELYRGTSAPPQGLVPEDVIRRLVKVISDATGSVGVIPGMEAANQRPWLYFAALVTYLDYAAVGYVFQEDWQWENWEDHVLPKLLNEVPEKPMGLPDGLATLVARILVSALPGLQDDFVRASGLSVLEAIQQAPVVVWIESIRNINANFTF
jgi:hypothetical protein